LAINSARPFTVADRLALFPESTRIRNDSLTLAGRSLIALAEEFGTPLYLYDRATLDAAVTTYKGALRAHYPAAAEIAYAGKAFLCTAVAEWTQLQRLNVDCTGEGEIAVARAGGVPRERIVVHGVNKSAADLEAALGQAGTLVVDNLSELSRVAARFAGFHGEFPSVWLRLQPGLAVATHHAHTQTGQSDSKFGMDSAELLQAAELCRKHHLPLNGLHFHQGSNFRDPQPLIAAIQTALDLARQIRMPERWHLSPGGGWAVAYHEDELPQPEIEDYVEAVASTVARECAARGLSLPTLHLEPGRSLIARAGIAAYRVGAVKRRAGRTWILTDGGMTDNPRHALYGARYSCLPATGLERPLRETVSIGGPYCESGDVLIEALPMPELEAGEVLAVPVSGAYHLAMSSNYNGARRPAVLWLEGESVQLIQRRETVEDLLRRDMSLS
jgi:diaminopimelate decarboxylase